MSNAGASSARTSALILSLGIVCGLAALGALVGQSALRFKEYERRVTVKGLAERELPADIVLWPIRYAAAENELPALYAKLEADGARIRSFLLEAGLSADEISTAPPSVTDKLAQRYDNGSRPAFRYTGLQTLTVYSRNVDLVRERLKQLPSLGKDGIVFSSNDYQHQVEYIFTRLNEIKPAMVEEATRNARTVAEKFAMDSNSQLGKIRSANQGQFSISSRDSQTPQIKKIRVVSTIEYYLSD